MFVIIKIELKINQSLETSLSFYADRLRIFLKNSNYKSSGMQKTSFVLNIICKIIINFFYY